MHSRLLFPTMALACLLALGAAPNAQAFWGFSTKTKKVDKSKLVAVIHIQGQYPDRSAGFSLFATPKTFQSLLKRIRRAEKDTRVKAVLFHFGGVAVGLAKANELRRAIQAVGKAGKKTYAMLDSVSTAGYVAASGCQKLVMTPGGMFFVPGLRAEMLYFKKMMDRIGLVGDFITIGNFKTAPEPFLRESMSEGQREQTTSLLTDLYQQLIETIAKARKLKQDDVKKVIDRALLTAEDAHKAKLIDRVAYRAALQGWIRSEVGLKPLRFVASYGRKKKKKPSSLWGMLTLLWAPKKSPVRSKKPKIAVVYAQGQIMYGSQPSGSFNNDGIWSDSFIKMLNKVEKLKNLRAIVLRINSPGGSALASDLIWKKLEKLKKKVPLFVSMGRVAASGGYYIAQGADMIVAEPSTLTGSIGVFGGKVVWRETFAKLGINVQAISRGKHSGIFSTFKRFSPGERAVIKKMLDKVYEDFVKKAALGRKMSYKELLKLAGGRVWTGRQAKARRLVDALGSLEDTLRLVRKRTGLKDAPQIITYPRPKGFFEALKGMSSNQTKPLPYAKTPLMLALSKLHPHLRTMILTLLKESKPQILMWTPVPHITLR